MEIFEDAVTKARLIYSFFVIMRFVNFAFVWLPVSQHGTIRPHS